MKTELYKGRGGKRPGAGRPATGRTTKTIRVPNDFPTSQELIDVLETLRNWKEFSDNASQSSVRWQRLRQLLDELPKSIFDSN